MSVVDTKVFSSTINVKYYGEKPIFYLRVRAVRRWFQAKGLLTTTIKSDNRLIVTKLHIVNV